MVLSFQFRKIIIEVFHSRATTNVMELKLTGKADDQIAATEADFYSWLLVAYTVQILNRNPRGPRRHSGEAFHS